ncbi:MAG: 23S rRNA (guanosine(2251)-2'-O)-methyltransferase RlmB [Acholeplasmatales bacterium]|nr:23S rRNA (guanosine(2251)-2'-O)-methyltransferase RlmB [Acholeplasmatales bacterium]
MIKIYGKNCVYAAIMANSDISVVYLSEDVVKSDKNILDILKKRVYKYVILPKKKLDIEFPYQNQGYGAHRENYMILDESYLDNLPKERGRVLILDGIQDPHNFGAILRSVDAFGYDLVILPKNRSVSVNETVAHVSTGAIEYTKIMYVNSLNNIVEKLKKQGYWICGTDAKGTVLSKDIDKSLNLAVIIGSEGFGMSKTLVNASDFLIKIPMKGHVNSLNASVSSGIVLHDLMANDN